MDLLHPALLPGWAAEIGVTVLAKGTLLLAGAWCLTALARRSSAATRYAVWVLGLVGLLALPLATVAVPGANLAWVTSPVTLLQASRTPGHGPVAGAPELGPAGEAPTDPSGTPSAARLARSPVVAGVLLLVWLIGACVLLARLALDFLRIARITARAGTGGVHRGITRRGVLLARRQGVQRRIRVVLCSELNMPVTWGIWRPVVLLPEHAEGWSQAYLDAVLLHELAHVRRWDYPWHLLSEVVRSLYWPNPLAWMACRRARVERERACDDTVIRFGTPSTDYARLLLELARSLAGRPVVRGVLAMARPSMLRTRINGVLDGSSNRRPAGRIAVAFCGAALLVLAVPLGSLRVWANPPQTDAGWAAALQRGDVETRLSAVAVLEAAGSEVAVRALADAVDDADPSVRRAAARALGRVGDAAAVPALVGVVTGSTDDLHQKRIAAASLRAIDGRAADRALAARLEHRGPATRGPTPERTAPDPVVWEPLVKVLLEDPDPEARSLAASALVDIGCEAAVPELALATKDTEADVRLAAARALAQLGTWPARRALARLSDDPDSRVRAVVDEALLCDEGGVIR